MSLFETMIRHWYIHLPVWVSAAVFCWAIVRAMRGRGWARWIVVGLGLAACLGAGFAAAGAVGGTLDALFPSDFDAQEVVDDMGGTAVVLFPVVAVAAVGDALRHLNEALMSGLLAIFAALFGAGFAMSQTKRGQGDA